MSPKTHSPPQPTNQSRCASCITTGDYNKRRALCCVCMGRSLCDLVCLLQSTRWCHSHYLLQTPACRHMHACVRTHTYTHTLSLSRQHFLLWSVAYILFLATLYIKLHQLHGNCLIFFFMFRIWFCSVLYNKSVSFGSIKNFVCFLLGNSLASEFYMPSFWNTLSVPCVFHLHRQMGMPTCLWSWNRQVGIPTCLWRWNRQSVLKQRHIKFRRQGITQKKAYNIQNTEKVLNQEY